MARLCISCFNKTDEMEGCLDCVEHKEAIPQSDDLIISNNAAYQAQFIPVDSFMSLVLEI